MNKSYTVIYHRQKKQPLENSTNIFIVGKQYMTTLHDHFFHLVNCAIVLWGKKPLNESEPLLKFYRLSIANSLVYSEGYGRIKKRNSYTVAYYKYNDRTTKYGKVLYFFACPFCCCSSCSSGV